MSQPQANRFIAIFLAIFVTLAVHAADAPKTIVFFGDSLTAGYGLDPDDAFPALIQKKIDAAGGQPWRVVNAGLSGETTAGGLRRLDWILRQPVDMFVIELGANDGLRGISPEASRSNLQAMIDRIRTKYPRVAVVLAGMQLPTNFGEAHTKAFAEIYPQLAKRNNLALIPFLLEGVGGVPNLNQADGIHPTAEGHKLVAATVWVTLQPLLK
ncbi:arylesterase [Oleiharenicola lentus]|uniref:arylesterase n=1 Tax=Oleiharenicola lentus TaxID=2508720 RepID=UPI003F679F0F